MWTAATGVSSTTALIREESQRSPGRKFIRCAIRERPPRRARRTTRTRRAHVDGESSALRGQSAAVRPGRGAARRAALAGGGKPIPAASNGNGNNNAQPPRRYQPAPPAPAPAATANFTAPPVSRPSSPGRQSLCADQRRSHPAPNNNSTDTRRYPSPRMQQDEQQNPRANPGNNPGGRIGAPQVPPAPPVERPAPAQPPPRSYNYVSPRNETPPSESRPNYSQPPAPDNPARNAPAPSSPPAQSQRSGGNRNQNGQQ